MKIDYSLLTSVVTDISDLEEKKARKQLVAHSRDRGINEIETVLFPFLDSFLEISGRAPVEHSYVVPVAVEPYNKIHQNTNIDLLNFLKEMYLIIRQEGYDYRLENRLDAQINAEENKTCLIMVEVPTDTLSKYDPKSYLYVEIGCPKASLTRVKEQRLIYVHRRHVEERLAQIKAWQALDHQIVPYLKTYHEMTKISIEELSKSSGIAKNSFTLLRGKQNVVVTTFVRIVDTYYERGERILCNPNLFDAILHATKHRKSLILREVEPEDLNSSNSSKQLFVYKYGTPPKERPKKKRSSWE